MTTTRINEIDLLRFCAALSVVFFHYTFRGYAADGLSAVSYPLLAPFSQYGYLGVELFFMISGFVILMSVRGGNVRSFAVSRIVRLYPAFWACCTLTFLFTLAIGTPRFSATIKEYAVNMTMSNEFLGTKSIDGAYWSLAIEMKFYAWVAVVLALFKISQTQRFLILWLLASVILEIFPVDRLRSALIVDYSAYFIAGAIFYLIWSQGLSATRIGILISSWLLALFEALHSVPSIEKHYRTSLNLWTVSVIITTFFVVILLVSLKRTGFFGRQHWMLAGVLTYPLYLLHQYIGFMIFNALHTFINPYSLLLGTIGFVLAMSYIVHVFIEKRLSSKLRSALNRFLDAVYARAVRSGLQAKTSSEQI